MTRDTRVPVVDFLRGLSCLGVLLYHVRVELWVGWWEITNKANEYSAFTRLVAWLSIPTPFLGYAILLFFLISGFCIHYPNSNSNSIYPCWKTYFIRRFWRIYPPYMAALLFTVGISFICFKLWGDNDWNPERILRVATLTQNYPPSNGQFLSNPSLWTIPLEVEFYILYPIAFYFFKTSKVRNLWIISLGLTAVSIVLEMKGLSWITFTAFFLWPSWLLGAWVAQNFQSPKIENLKVHNQILCMLFSLALALASRYLNWTTWTQYVSWTIFYLSFFIFCLSNTNLLILFIGKEIFKVTSWIGKISFSLYLIHFPLFKLFGYLHLEIFRSKPANFLITLLYIVPVILIAFLFFKFVEKPIHQWSRNRT